jgi:hypothetical protein
MVLSKETRMQIVEDMLFAIARTGSSKEVSIEYIADGISPDYILSFEKAAINIWNKYGMSILLYLT